MRIEIKITPRDGKGKTLIRELEIDESDLQHLTPEQKANIPNLETKGLIQELLNVDLEVNGEKEYWFAQ